MTAAPPVDPGQIASPALKLTSVGAAWWAGVNWGAVASFLACVYTGILIFDWCWKRFLRQCLIRRGLWSRASPYLRDSERAALDDEGARP